MTLQWSKLRKPASSFSGTVEPLGLGEVRSSLRYLSTPPIKFTGRPICMHRQAAGYEIRIDRAHLYDAAEENGGSEVDVRHLKGAAKTWKRRRSR